MITTKTVYRVAGAKYEVASIPPRDSEFVGIFRRVVKPDSGMYGWHYVPARDARQPEVGTLEALERRL